MSGAKGWSFQNPSFQIYYYLAETGCRWAILTNGRLWRLYSSEPKPDMQVYYEVDLPALLQSGNPDDLAYFWLFFRCSAFVAGVEGVSFLEQVQAESDLAADKLREDVREGVYRALLEACRGFLGYAPNGLGESDLDEVYDNALVFLYRLLFVLYASIHDFRAADLAAPRSQFCPPGSTCRLCMTARESGADRIAAG